MWGSARSRVPHPLLHLSPHPSLPGPAALLCRQWLRGPSLLPDDKGETKTAPGLLDHPRRHWSRTPPQQGGHCDPQPCSQAEAGLQAASVLCGSDIESSDAREAVWAIQHQGREGMSCSTGLLHDGDGSDTSGDTTPHPWREDPGGLLRGYTHWLDSEDPLQAYRVPAASAERNGMTWE